MKNLYALKRTHNIFLSVIVLLLVVIIYTEAFSQTRVRFGSVIPADSPWEEGIKNYFDHVEKKTGGKVKFRTFLGGQLGGEVEMIRSIAMGTLDAGAFTLAGIAEGLSIPELQVFELPFLFENDEEADYVMDKMFDRMAKILENKGLILVMWGTNGWRSIGTKSKAVTAPVHLNGMKMRSQESEVHVNFYRTLGATPVPVSAPEVLLALRTGMVDGFDQAPVFSVSAGWMNTIKYFTLSRHIYQPGAIVISKRFFDRLPDSYKEHVRAADVRSDLQKKSRELIRKEDVAILEILEPTFGVELIRLTPTQRDAFKRSSQPVYRQMEKSIGKNLIMEVQRLIKK